jgi:D-alanine-D-alanine ligase
MNAQTERDAPLKVAVLLGDPRLPYAYGVDGRFGEEERMAVERLREALDGLDGFRFAYLDDHTGLIDTLRARPPALALNLCDTGYRNVQRHELNIPALLELLDIPYTGAGPVCMSLCTDKALVRALAVAQGIPVPNETFVDLTADPLVLPELYPALIKPNAADGSFGITADCVVADAPQAEAYMLWLRERLERPQALIQDFLTGPEYTVGLIGNPDDGITVLPPLVIDYSHLDPDLPPILSYGSKADPDSPYWQGLRFHPADLDDATYGRLVSHSTALFARLGCRDYARFDFRAGPDGEPRLLDANYNPTWSWDGKMALMAGYAGHDYAWMLRTILEAAARRCSLGG